MVGTGAGVGLRTGWCGAPLHPCSATGCKDRKMDPAVDPNCGPKCPPKSGPKLGLFPSNSGPKSGPTLGLFPPSSGPNSFLVEIDVWDRWTEISCSVDQKAPNIFRPTHPPAPLAILERVSRQHFGPAPGPSFEPRMASPSQQGHL